MKLREHLYLLSGGVYGKLGNVYALQHDSGDMMHWISYGRIWLTGIYPNTKSRMFF